MPAWTSSERREKRCGECGKAFKPKEPRQSVRYLPCGFLMWIHPACFNSAVHHDVPPRPAHKTVLEGKLAAAQADLIEAHVADSLRHHPEG